ncbi:MAG: YeeE/YedE family protein [Sandaracinaceae bacterium]|nr:YeeE/YedE family protein [Sandaracinaceae bacterium]MBK7773353.1 YeeE/YedE family protein [Sandaracinaceae bacterium]MBK8411335.1 YeeE/YedE family protein [Sandaracinaceae bacterium]MBK8592647.1 YeeE/YedE family protein [Sandaracinaceae bacterium]MBP7683689.1 YeeE/YedE family protein [Deltaproteobacteria bacterium]
MKSHLITIALGVAFGFCLSRIGFTSWDEVHAMFTFSDLRLVIAFGTAVALLSVGWVVVRRLRPSDPAFSPRPIHKGTLVGGVLFGAGWALTGACPSIALVQLGEGKLGALVTLVGIFAGNALYAAVHERYFRFSVGSCEG